MDFTWTGCIEVYLYNKKRVQDPQTPVNTTTDSIMFVILNFATTINIITKEQRFTRPMIVHFDTIFVRFSTV